MDLPRFDRRDTLEAYQLARLNELLPELTRSNGFYAPRLRAAGLDRGVKSLAEFRERMPFTEKRQLATDQASHPPYGTNVTYPRERFVRLHQTSSTTGAPLRWLDTEESWAWMRAAWRRVLEEAGVTAADTMFFAFSFGPFIGFWLGFEAAQELGCLCIPGGPTDSATRLQLMKANGVTALGCTPTYAIRLGEVARAESMDAGSLAVRKIIVGGEPGGSVPATRARIESLWPGAEVYDHYGMTEVGPVTYQRAGDDPSVVRVIEEAVLLEVIDPASGQPLGEAAERLGEIVATSLGRAGTPVLRYRSGDLVRPLPLSDTEPFLRFEHGIQARLDHMVVVRGVNLYPSAVDEIIRGVGGVAEYRVEIDRSNAMIELRIQVEPERTCEDTGGLCRAIERRFREAYNLRVPVAPVGPDALPRFELKARRWVDAVP